VRDEEHLVDHNPKPGWTWWRPPPNKKNSWWGLRGKTFWDWLDLLIVPFFIALSVGGLGLLQARTQQQVEEHRAQQTTLQAYLDQMGTLLVQRNLRTSGDIDVQNFARARTLTTLDALNPERKRRVLRFLEETKLLRRASLSEEEAITDDCPQDKSPSIPQDKKPVISLK
jgi:Tfp pilus assembly protein PilV